MRKADDGIKRLRPGAADAGTLREVPGMQTVEASGVGAAHVDGAAFERARELYNTHLWGPLAAGEFGLSAYLGVLETLSREHREYCPVFLLWRVWGSHPSAPLALDSLGCMSPNRLLSLEALAARFRPHRRCYASVNGLCRQVRPEGLGGPAFAPCGADVSAAWHRARRYGRSGKENRS